MARTSRSLQPPLRCRRTPTRYPPTPTRQFTLTPASKDGASVPERTGIVDLDAIIEGFVSHDTKPLLSLLRYTTVPCTHAGGLGGPPACRPDQEEGTPVERMPVSSCELEWRPPHEFERTLASLVMADIYGVYRATSEVYFTGDYVIVLSDPEMTIGTEVVIEDGRIVAVDFSCVLPPEELVELHGLDEALFRPNEP